MVKEISNGRRSISKAKFKEKFGLQLIIHLIGANFITPLYSVWFPVTLANEAKQSQGIAELVPSGARNLRVCFGYTSQPLVLLAMTTFQWRSL